MIRRGQIWLAELGTPRGASPGYKRPVVVVQSNVFNKTNINSVIVAILTTNQRLALMPGNVSVGRGVAGIKEDSVINITQIFTIDKNDLVEAWGQLPKDAIKQLDAGLKLVLHLNTN